MSKTLYVGNLPFSVSSEDLVEKFSSAGSVASAKVITDQETGRSKGFAFVDMESDADAEKAISMFHGSDFSGRSMVVNEARPKTAGGGGGRGPRPSRGGPGGGGNRNFKRDRGDRF